MERTTAIGLAAVAVVGGLLAIGLTVSMLPPAPEAPTVDPVPSAVAAASTRAQGTAPPGAAADDDAPLTRPHPPDVIIDHAAQRRNDPDALPPGFDLPPDEDPPPPPPTGVLEAPYLDAQALIRQKVMEGLAADPSEQDVVDHVQAHIADVHAVAMDFVKISKTHPDPDVREDALDYAANLYDRTADHIPIVAPMAGDQSGWAEEHAELTGMLRDKASALRGDDDDRR